MNTRKILILCAGLAAVGCTESANDPLPSWNDTPIKEKIIEYVEVKAADIPLEDRVAVFDMDGTIACERPLWFEMVVSAKKMDDLQKAHPELSGLREYQYGARLTADPCDTSVTNNWYVDGKNYLEMLLEKPFVGENYEDYVTYSRELLTTLEAPKYGMKYADMFYQPMLELLDYLKENEFQIYIVSGSMQAIVWSVCPEVTGLDRHHLIGTRQQLAVSFKDGLTYTIQDEVQEPKNNYYGKSVNIWNQIGKVPVIAIGNTVGDFGMFHTASASPYPHFVMMINHDDAEREYAYEPFYTLPAPDWKDSLKTNGWIQADMSKEFKVIWKD